MEVNNIEIAKKLAKCFLFSGLNHDTVSNLLSKINVNIQTFPRGEVIYSPDNFEKRMGFVIEGECSIYKKRSQGSDIPLNTVGAFGCFGITAALTSKEEFPTTILAKRKCTIAFFTRDDLTVLIKENSTVSMNIIRFMCERIIFLNEKVTTFSSDNVEQKLARLILCDRNIAGVSEFKFNKKHAAETINAGRASLYRALDSLKEKGLITYDNKFIRITNLEGLERISK